MCSFPMDVKVSGKEFSVPGCLAKSILEKKAGNYLVMGELSIFLPLSTNVSLLKQRGY